MGSVDVPDCMCAWISAGFNGNWDGRNSGMHGLSGEAYICVIVNYNFFISV